MAIAELELARGVHEIHGPKHSPRVLEYHQATTFKAETDEVPWCSSFVNWCMREAGIEGTQSAAARSWLTWGEGLDAPRYGCVTVLSRGSNPMQGHVGFYVGERPDAVLVLAGNQGDAVSIAAFNRARILAYRWPK
jgi:uncharacterized protein (TIGR02594 family)